MSYASKLRSLLTTMNDDRYYSEICRDIDKLGCQMEECGHATSDIRKFLRRVIGLFGGPRMGEYLFEYFINSWGANTLAKAETKFDRANCPNSFGLFWSLTFEPDGDLDHCRKHVDIVHSQPQLTLEQFKARRRREEMRIRRIWERRGTPLPDDWRLYPSD
ncbi:hypothetical protein ACYFX5_20035 [Bremerella sp. T1]|uniref:hypothetical protein n=1 Tax=Bremerella sp. TYQ1 TaxID=3119568 RepID=UPI001CCD55A6|nr:hypothetical protein [Bremerella volcania]UBM35333.1 hypothetical protein LA756_21980 [Bremerella volcania]